MKKKKNNLVNPCLYTQHFVGPLGEHREDLADAYLHQIRYAQAKIDRLKNPKFSDYSIAKHQEKSVIKFWEEMRDGLLSELAEPFRLDVIKELGLKIWQPESLKKICLSFVNKIGLFKTNTLPTELQENLMEIVQQQKQV